MSVELDHYRSFISPFRANKHERLTDRKKTPTYFDFCLSLPDSAGPAACLLPAGCGGEFTGPDRQDGQSRPLHPPHQRGQHPEPTTPPAAVQHHHQQLYTTLRKARSVIYSNAIISSCIRPYAKQGQSFIVTPSLADVYDPTQSKVSHL